MQEILCGGSRLHEPVTATRYRVLVGVLVAGLGIGLSAAGDAAPVLPAATKSITPDGQAQPTRAWLTFCRKIPSECAVDRSEPDVITLTPETWATIKSVNVRVNSTITAIPDQDHLGVEDRWDYPDDGKGDCEDIQLLKRKLLTEAGLPRRAMRMTVVLDEAGAGHAVLMVRTNRGDLILDNKRDAVLPWMRTGYVYLKREGSEGRAWVWLKEQTSPTTTAAR
jgi:predicted transglutaminase-like cysteine proteinase